MDKGAEEDKEVEHRRKEPRPEVVVEAGAEADEAMLERARAEVVEEELEAKEEVEE